VTFWNGKSLPGVMALSLTRRPLTTRGGRQRAPWSSIAYLFCDIKDLVSRLLFSVFYNLKALINLLVKPPSSLQLLHFKSYM
jgi:hypothetical protein